MSEKKKPVELKENDLKKVIGGLTNGDPGSGECGYCKYCNRETLQIYQGSDAGWKGKIAFSCFVWKCSECNNDNYIRVDNGEYL